jgi:dTDP-4-dehydrorhamnose 3,5-epimerase
VILSGENKKQFLIPKGFAHGFSVLSDNAIFTYKCDNFYNKESERGIMFNDSKINIDWKINNGIEVVERNEVKR